MGHTYAEKLFLVCLKSQLHWVLCILSGNAICMISKYISNSQITLDRTGLAVWGTNSCSPQMSFPYGLVEPTARAPQKRKLKGANAHGCYRWHMPPQSRAQRSAKSLFKTICPGREGRRGLGVVATGIGDWGEGKGPAGQAWRFFF